MTDAARPPRPAAPHCGRGGAPKNCSPTRAPEAWRATPPAPGAPQPPRDDRRRHRGGQNGVLAVVPRAAPPGGVAEVFQVGREERQPVMRAGRAAARRWVMLAPPLVGEGGRPPPHQPLIERRR